MDNQPIPNDQLSLKEILKKGKEWTVFLRSKWLTILLTMILGALLGLIFSYFKKPIYTATLTFALEDEKAGNNMSNAMGLANTLGLDVGSGGGGIFMGSNLTILFKSRSMVEQTLLSPVMVNGQKISLAEMYIQNNEWRKKWEKKAYLKNIKFLPNDNRTNFTRVHDSILGVIYEDLYKYGLDVAQKNEKAGVISVDVSSKNESFAKYFAEALTDNVSEFYVMTKSKKAKINMDILQRQTDSIRDVLSGAITSVAVANDQVFGLNPAMNVKRAPSTRKQVDVQANTVILTELVKQTELAKVNYRKETPLIQIIDKPIFPLQKNSLSKFKGMAIGGVLAGFLMVFWLIIKRIFDDL